MFNMKAIVDPPSPGSRLDADHPENGVLIPRRITHDGIIPLTQVNEVFARAREPKALEVYPCGHFGLYPGRPFHEAAAQRAAGWFGRWL